MLESESSARKYQCAYTQISCRRHVDHAVEKQVAGLSIGRSDSRYASNGRENGFAQYGYTQPDIVKDNYYASAAAPGAAGADYYSYNNEFSRYPDYGYGARYAEYEAPVRRYPPASAYPSSDHHGSYGPQQQQQHFAPPPPPPPPRHPDSSLPPSEHASHVAPPPPRRSSSNGAPVEFTSALVGPPMARTSSSNGSAVSEPQGAYLQPPPPPPRRPAEPRVSSNGSAASESAGNEVSVDNRARAAATAALSGYRVSHDDCKQPAKDQVGAVRRAA